MGLCMLTFIELSAIEHRAIGATHVCQGPFAFLPAELGMPFRHSRILDVNVSRFCATHREHCSGLCEGGTLAGPADCLQF